MTLLPRRWTLHRLRGRLERVEREKEEALHALIVRDETIGSRPRYDYQDPGLVGSMLDEIATLKARIALLEHADSGVSMAEEAGPDAPRAAPRLLPANKVVDVAFDVLRNQLTQMQSENDHGRIGVEALRQALHIALASEQVLDLAFHGLRTEMIRIQRSTATSKIGLDALRDAMRAALAPEMPELAVYTTQWDGHWPDLNRPGTPADASRDGWHWIQAPGKAPVPLSWHADTGRWGHRTAGFKPRKVFDDGVRYYGPCLVPNVPETDDDHFGGSFDTPAMPGEPPAPVE